MLKADMRYDRKCDLQIIVNALRKKEKRIETELFQVHNHNGDIILWQLIKQYRHIS